ncbi:MAG TPA: ankyrin repeat domain-containing protein [Bryobacteraceae bacterium]|nr:ankyrin repeat domain-containing protein [Bryobacteraceae bacterium]
MPLPDRHLLIRALESDDRNAIAGLLPAHSDFLNVPDQRPLITWAQNRTTAQLLLEHGADVHTVGRWWASGFGTDKVRIEVADFLVERGAPLTVHAAAGLGLTDRLRKMLDSDPELVEAKGGDGCTPLHFARGLETAALLLERGARVDARDDDHDSTPAQWLIGRAPEVTRFLIEHGAAPDIFMATGLGDEALVKKLIDADRRCLAQRIGRLPDIPPIGHKGRGGSIYQWTLAFNSYAHQVALLKGHEGLYRFLYEQSDSETQLLVSCVLAHREDALAIAANNPGMVASLSDLDRELVARYCWETNTNYEAVKLMLDVGFPVAHPERSHGYTPLHNAAWAGSADLVDLLIERGHPVDLRDPGYSSTAIGWAVHCCIVAKRHPEAEYGRVVKSLVDAGCPWDDIQLPTGDSRIDDVLMQRP